MAIRLPVRKRPKYGNRRTFACRACGTAYDAKVDCCGRITLHFASQRELHRYRELRFMEIGGLISDLQVQVSYPLIVADVLICTYVADYVYLQDGKRVVSDAKGVKTREYKIKKKLMFAIYGIEVREV